MLYKVKVEVEMMVDSSDNQSAINEAAKYVIQEVETYGLYFPNIRVRFLRIGKVRFHMGVVISHALNM
jgi:hypothetical protein